MKKNQQKQAQKESTPALPAIDDFFTKLLDKRQKHYVEKLAKIADLEKKKITELTPEQQDLVHNKHLTHERIKYFDDIKDLYYQAHTKKEVPTQVATTSGSNTGVVAANVLNLYFTGNVLQHLTNTSQKAVEATLSQAQQSQVSQVWGKVFNHAHTHETLEESKTTLTNALNDNELVSALQNTVNSRILEKHQHAHPEKHQTNVQTEIHLVKGHTHSAYNHTQTHVHAPAPVQAPAQKGLFHDSEEEDEHDDHPTHKHKNSHHVHKETEQTQTEAQSEFKIIALPEDNNEGNENWIKVGNGERQHRGRGGPRGGRGRGPRREEGDEHRGDGEHKRHFRHKKEGEGEAVEGEKAEEQEGENRGERRGRGFRGPRSGRPQNREEGEKTEGVEAKDGERPHRGRGRGRGYRGNGEGRGEPRGDPRGEQRGEHRGEYRGERRPRGEGYRGKNPRTQEQAPQGENQ